MNNDVFGVKGHFTTNPEISQIFGEIMGAWVFQEWHRFDCPKPLRLIEFGPGRGTLMSDMVRTIVKLQKDDNNIEIRMIEVSNHLKQIQKKTLAERKETDVLERTKWFEQIEELDENYTGFNAFIAHEFFDALPIHKFVRDPNNKKWRELLIDYNQDQQLIFKISNQPSLSSKLLIPKDFQGDHIEVCPQAPLLLEKVAKNINNTGNGCMLICDYGFQDNQQIDEDTRATTLMKPQRNNRDTFRAFKNHQPWHPLKDPGDADLTADVDFGYLKSQLAGKARFFGPVNQRDFLVQCGLEARFSVLMKNASEHEQKELMSGVKMICEDMGQRYKFLSMFPLNTEHLFHKNPPAGFYTMERM